MIAGSGTKLVGRLDACVGVREGQELDMFIDMNRIHVFEPGELGMNVTARRQPEAMARAR